MTALAGLTAQWLKKDSIPQNVESNGVPDNHKIFEKNNIDLDDVVIADGIAQLRKKYKAFLEKCKGNEVEKSIIDGLPSDLNDIVNNPYICDSMRKWKYLLPPLLDSQVLYKILNAAVEKEEEFLVFFRTGGDEAAAGFLIDQEAHLLNLDFGNMGPTNKILGKVIKNKDGNIVDYFLQEVYEIALKHLLHGDAVGFIESVCTLGEKLTATHESTRMKEDEFEKFIETNNFEKVSYQEYLDACKQSYNAAHQRQVGRDLVALAKAGIASQNPEIQHPSVEQVACYLANHFYMIGEGEQECEELIEYIESSQAGVDGFLNNNKDYILERIKLLKSGNLSADDFMMAIIDFVYIRLRKNESKGIKNGIELRKPLPGEGVNRDRFVSRKVQLLDVQAAITQMLPQNYEEHKAISNYLEQFLHRAKQNKGQNLTLVDPLSSKKVCGITKRYKKPSQYENTGQRIVDLSQQIVALDQQEDPDETLLIEKSELYSNLNEIRYTNMNTEGDVVSENFLKNVALEKYPFVLDQYQLVTINLERSGAFNSVDYELLDNIISQVRPHLADHCKIECFKIGRDGGGQLRYVGQPLTVEQWDKIITTLNSFSELIQRKQKDLYNDIQTDDIVRRANKIYNIDDNGQPEAPAINGAGTFTYKIHGTVKRFLGDGKIISPDMKKTFYQAVA